MSSAVEEYGQALPEAYQAVLADPELGRAELARRRLPDFIREAWKVLEPGRAYVPNWHLDAIADALMAVHQGHLKRLVINIPPRCMKSLSVSVLWPVWSWIHDPASRWLFVTYAQELSTRDSLKRRDLIRSPWFQRHFGPLTAELKDDEDRKQRFANQAQGFMLATSFGGMATGEGADVLVIDDPHNVTDADSDAKRLETNRTYREQLSSRFNDLVHGRLVLVMQRVHESDLTGEVLETEDGWAHLCLPMRFERERRCIVEIRPGFTIEDPRTEEGELLWPRRIPEPAVQRLETALGEYAAAGQLQQRPSPRGGGLFKPARIEIVGAEPLDLVPGTIVRGWDKAGTAGGGKYTAGVKVAQRESGRWVVLDVQRGQLGRTDREHLIQQCAKVDGVDCSIAMEQEPGSGGKDQALDSIAGLAGFDAVAITAAGKGDKEARATPFARQVNAGNVDMVEGEWNREFLHQLERFPVGTYVDDVDAVAVAFNRAARHLTNIDDALEAMEQGASPAELEAADRELADLDAWLDSEDDDLEEDGGWD